MARLGFAHFGSRAPRAGKLLLVEDSPETQRALQRAVAHLGHSVRAVSSAEEADQWLSLERFDVCLLDIELPRMSGVEFLDWALARDPEMAVIMLTGVDVPEVATTCMEHGARTYLVKPIDQEFLRLAIRDALAVRSVLVERNDLCTT